MLYVVKLPNRNAYYVYYQDLPLNSTIVYKNNTTNYNEICSKLEKLKIDGGGYIMNLEDIINIIEKHSINVENAYTRYINENVDDYYEHLFTN